MTVSTNRGKIVSMKVVNRRERWIGFRLNILGIRVWENTCQLVAISRGQWDTLGPRWDLPVQVPVTPEDLKAAASDTLRLTAYQYVNQNPGTDLADLLALRKDFEVAMRGATTSS
jgi:hypothetical protein